MFERGSAATPRTTARERLERRAGAAKRALDRTIDNLVRARITDAVLPVLRGAHAAAAAELASAATSSKVVTLHPGAVAGYVRDLEVLANALAHDQAEGVTLAADAVRRVIDAVTGMPAPAGTASEISVEGRLASLIEAPPGRSPPDCRRTYW